MEFATRKEVQEILQNMLQIERQKQNGEAKNLPLMIEIQKQHDCKTRALMTAMTLVLSTLDQKYPGAGEEICKQLEDCETVDAETKSKFDGQQAANENLAALIRSYLQ